MKRIALAALIFLGLALPGLGFAKDIAIGFTASETGKLNTDFTLQLAGIELWRDQVNAAGGVKVGQNKSKVKLVYYDDQSESNRVQQLYTRLISADKADFLFSPYSSGLAATAAIISEQYGKVMVTTGAAEGKTYTLGNKYLFQTYTPANLYLASAMDAVKAKDPGAKIALIYENDGFAKAVAAGAKAYAQKLGLSVVIDEAYDSSTTDFSPILNKVVTSGATVLLGGGHFADGSTLARQLHEQNLHLKMISLLVAPDAPKFAELGNAAAGVTVPSQWEAEAGYKPDFGPTVQQFAKDFEKKVHQTPGYHAAGGYAAGLLLQHAIEQAGSLDTDKVAAALNKLDATIFYGHVKFATAPEQHGLQMGHSMVLAQWQKNATGQLVKQIVWPIAASTVPLQYPIGK
jgi:branched-chain amino acid transport system substrate-binding protein